MDENYPNRYLSHYLLIQLQFKIKKMIIEPTLFLDEKKYRRNIEKMVSKF